MKNPVDHSRETRNPRVVGVAYALWLFALTVAFLKFPDSEVILELSLMLGAVPASLHIFVLRIDPDGLSYSLWYMWAFLLVFLFGYVINPISWTDLIQICNVLFAFLIALLIVSSYESSLVERMLRPFSLMMVPYLVYINIFGSYRWGRLEAGVQPNVWGLLAVCLAASSFAFRNWMVMAVCWLVALVTLYDASSREGMIAFAGGAVIFLAYWGKYERKWDISWKVVIGVAGCVCAVVIVAAFPDFFLNDVMKINDARRGLSSGFTGRDQAWAEAIRVWTTSPIVGVGFRKHEDYMIVTQLSAHNAYLAMLADTGVVGLTLYVTFVISSIVSAFKHLDDPKQRYLVAGIIFTYALVGMFDRRAINVGNPFSLIFIVACFWALRAAAQHKESVCHFSTQ
jgi:O-antigen ligase